ncbi:hypothetical protein [Methyloglobulus sp.]|uniref:lipopolysaccharide biosynthesis protein n=1 Tax=Methyloglobulus sp. TaxID=2518622 RepID=UPI0032B704CB
MLVKFFKLTGWAAVAQLLLIIFAPLLTRLYGPSIYGQYGVVVSIASLYAVVAALRMDILGFRFTSDIRSHKVSGLLAVFTSALILGIAVFFYSEVNAINHAISLRIWAICIVAGVFNLATQWIITSKDYATYSRVRVWQVFLQVAISLILGLKEVSDGLLIGVCSSQIIASIMLFRKNSTLYKKADLVAGLLVLRKEWRFAIINSLSTVMLYSAPLIPTFLITVNYGTKLAGYYFLCAQIFSAPLSVVRRALLNICTAEFSDRSFAVQWLSRNGGKIFKIALGLSTLSFILVMVLWFYGEIILTFVFGSEWVSAGKIAYLVLCLFIVDTCCQPLTNLMSIWGYEKINFMLEICRFIFVVVLPFIVFSFYLLRFTFESYILYHCATMIIFYFIHAISTYRLIKTT